MTTRHVLPRFTVRKLTKYFELGLHIHCTISTVRTNRRFDIEHHTGGIATRVMRCWSTLFVCRRSYGSQQVYYAWKHLPNDDLMTASVVNIEHAPWATLMTPRWISIFEEARLLQTSERVRFLTTTCNSLTANKWSVTSCSWSMLLIVLFAENDPHLPEIKKQVQLERMSHTWWHPG